MPVPELREQWTLNCRSLSVHRAARPVIHNISFTLRSGECVCLIGPNGSGKTTLLLTLLGLLKPAAGQVILSLEPDQHKSADRSPSGKPTTTETALNRIPARERGRFVAYVPQTLTTITDFTVYDIVAAGRFPYVSPLRPLAQSDEAIVRRAMSLCEIESLTDRPISAVSGGERQKALLAAAVAQDTPLVLLDEPTNSLDPAYQIALARLILEWNAQGRTVVTVSHDLQLAAALGGRTIALRAGRIAADGPADEILTPSLLGTIYGSEFVAIKLPDGRNSISPAWPARSSKN
ncbi:MAG: ABC transporter ATP-binding protein [Phycisphaerales bacterium]|nr:ABC transporter ATP-binding protein [Phycisphaerales bacterium]